jgi:hypothetical protein
MTLLSFRNGLRVMYVLGFTFVITVFFFGSPYYLMPLGLRPHSELHDSLRPAGLWGHGLGIVGSTMILLLLTYSLRKRRRAGLRFGRLSRWLDVHIFFGVMGPLLITLHTAMKFGGFVSISFYSMMLVAFSGVFGRYIYMQIPRDARGHALGIDHARERLEEIQETMRDRYKVGPETIEGIRRFAATPLEGDVTKMNAGAGGHKTSAVGAIAYTLWHDLTLRYRVRRLRSFIRHGNQSVSPALVDEVVKLAR